MYLTCALCALALLNGAAAHSSNGPRAFGLVRKASNGTATTSTSASRSSVLPCTTTIISILGEVFVGIEGSCQTVTIVSTPQVHSASTSAAEATSRATSSSIPTSTTSTTPRHVTSTTSIPPSTSVERASGVSVSSSSSASTPHLAQTSSEKTSSTSSIAQIGTTLGGNGGAGGNGGQSTSSADQVATTPISTPDQKTGESTILRSSDLLLTTSAAPVSITTSIPPVWISDGSSSTAISVSQPASTSKSDTVIVGTTTQTSNQVIGTTPASSSQSPAHSFSASNIVGTTQTSEFGSAPPTSSDILSSTRISPIFGSTTSADTHPTTHTSQTGVVVSTYSQSPTQTPLSQTSGSQLPASSSAGTPISNSASTQISQSISQVGTASQQSSASVKQSNSPSGTASASPISGSASTSASGSNSQVGTTTQQSSPSNSQASNTDSASTSGASASTTPTSTSYAPILYGTQTISRVSSSLFIFGTQTLTPGSAITISGEVISAGTGGAIIINAVPPTTTSSSSSQTQSPEVIVVGGTSITANSNSDFVIGSQTLSAGGAVTESGEVITLPSVSSTPTSSGTGTGSGTGGEASKTTGGSTLVTSTLSLGQEGPITSVLIGGQTLTAGGRVTVGGDVLSLASGSAGSGIVVVSTVTVMGAAPSSTKKSAAPTLGVGNSQLTLLVLSFALGVYFGA